MSRTTPTETDWSGVTDADRRALDGQSLATDIGIDQPELARRKSFLDLTETDAERLAAMEAVVDDASDDLVEAFYDWLRSDAEVEAVLSRSSLPIEALKRSQRTYLNRGESPAVHSSCRISFHTGKIM